MAPNIKPIRIVLTGAHGTGKTTLANKLAAGLSALRKQVVVSSETARILCSQSGSPDFFRRKHNTISKQMLIMLYHLHQEQLILNTPDGGPDYAIFDRGLLDHWAYTSVMHEDALRAEGVYELFANTVVAHLSQYNYLIYVPIEFPPKDDGTRESDGRFQRDVDQEIKKIIGSSGVEVTEVRGSVDTRVECILRLLKINPNSSSYEQ